MAAAIDPAPFSAECFPRHPCKPYGPGNFFQTDHTPYYMHLNMEVNQVYGSWINQSNTNSTKKKRSMTGAMPD